MDQEGFTRQAELLRKNITEWDQRFQQLDDWPSLLGRLNAATNQTGSMDGSIDGVWEHFVYVPKLSTANPQDIPAFLSTRLEALVQQLPNNKEAASPIVMTDDDTPLTRLAAFGKNAEKIQTAYEDTMVRFG